jgi:hypothetical protein
MWALLGVRPVRRYNLVRNNRDRGLHGLSQRRTISKHYGKMAQVERKVVFRDWMVRFHNM